MIRVLRWIAVAVAIAAAVDPAITVSARARPRIAVIGSLRSGNEADVYVELSRRFQVVPADDPSSEATVVVGDRYPDVAIPETTRVATVTGPGGFGGFASFSAPRSVPPGSTIHLEAEVAGTPGAKTELVATIGNAVLERASHEWTDSSRWRAAFDVVPVGEPPYVITVAAGGMLGPRATAVVDVAERLPVLVYEARPSWATTFVRRALEGDPRFAVASTDVTSRAIAVRTIDAPPGLQSADLNRYRVVIVGGLDRLTAGDALALNRFAIDRGGSIAVLPDARSESDAVRSLVGMPGREQLLEKPAALAVEPPLPRIEASELVPYSPPADARILAWTSGAERIPIVWTAARGEGRLLVSGALDAWRFRTGIGFDRFWQSAIAGLALAVRPPLSIDVIPPREFDGTTRVRVRVRDMDPSQPASVTATLASGEPVRLWPDPERGSFSGIVSGHHPGLNRIDVVATNGGRAEHGSARFVDGAGIPENDENAVPLSLLSATRGGIDVNADDLSRLERWLRETIPARSAAIPTHPMRSPWWVVPFAACLCAEWWARRRRGLR